MREYICVRNEVNMSVDGGNERNEWSCGIVNNLEASLVVNTRRRRSKL
jgi:hypothetical protein